MSADTIPSCADGQTAATLSHWRDGALSPIESEHMSQHVAGCAACRARLADYEAIADGLRAIRVPDPRGDYGRDPRSAPVPRRARSWQPLRATPRWHVAGGLGAVAAVLLVALAFAQVFAGLHNRAVGVRTPTTLHTPTAPTGTSTATVSPTPVALQPLAWQAHQSLPDGINSSAYYGVFTLANADGNDAYACDVTPPPADGQPATTAQTRVWMTHDSGTHWKLTLTFNGPTDASSCVVTTDDYDRNLVVAAASYAFRAAPPSPNHSITYVSNTAGLTWQKLPGSQLFTQLASFRGEVFALRKVTQGTQLDSPYTTELAVSLDGLQTWTTIDLPIVGQRGDQGFPQHLWLNPTNGNLLLEMQDQSNQDALTLWQTVDVGAHWHPFGQTASTSASPNFVVQAPAAGQSWFVCVSTYDPSGPGQNTLACTSDNGATWTPRAALAPRSGPSVTGKGATPSTGAALVFAISDDGAVLAVAAQSFSSDGSIASYALYRLPQGASQWQSLGPVPEFSVQYAPAPGSGVLWAVPAQGIVLDPHNRVFTVPYS